eukprot:scaffold9715_cov113-Isochrysis_galbana.AAC.11
MTTATDHSPQTLTTETQRRPPDRKSATSARRPLPLGTLEGPWALPPAPPPPPRLCPAPSPSPPAL